MTRLQERRPQPGAAPSTSVGPWFLDRFLAAVAAAVPGDTPVAYAVLRPRPPVALTRALARTGEGDLRQSAPVETMSDAFADLGSFEPHAVGSSELTAEETAHEVVARLRAGGLDLGRELG